MQASFSSHSTIQLPARGVFSVPDAAGVQLLCTCGTLWLTVDGDPRDIILEPGDSFAGSGHGRMVVYALGAATLRVRDAAARQQPVPHTWGRWPRTTAQVPV